MNILNQYKKIKQNIENYSFNIPTNLIVVTKGRSLADIQKIINVLQAEIATLKSRFKNKGSGETVEFKLLK